MVTLLTSPSECTLARNPALFTLLCTTSGGALFAAKGEKTELTFGALSARFTIGQTYTLSYTEPDGTTATMVFTAATSPTGTNQIPANTSSGYTSASYWAAVRSIVGGHPSVAPFFSASSNSSQLSLQERTGATGWTITAATSTAFTITNTAGTADVTPENYRARIEVFFETAYKSGNYARVSQCEGTPDTDGKINFDISGILASECRNSRVEPLVPLYATDTPILADNLRRYYVRFTEESGTPVAVSAWTVDQVRYVVDGGVAQSLWAESNYLEDITADTSLLTWAADGRTIGTADRVLLPWYNYTGATVNTILEYTPYDVNTGLSATGALFRYEADQIPVGKYETLLIPIAPELLGLTDADNYRFTVRVVDASSPYDGGSPEYLSPLRTYYIDRGYYHSIRQLQYLNSFGVPEVWRCTGQFDKNISVSRQQASRVLLPGYNQYATDTRQIAATWNPSFVYRTGLLRLADAEILQEMLIAGDVYDVSVDGYIPLRITNTQDDVSTSTPRLNSYELRALPRLDMINFSKKQITQQSAMAWQEPDGSYWFDSLLQPWTLP